MSLDEAGRIRLVRENTVLMQPPLVPEVRLHLAHESHALWLRTEEELQEIGLPPPFWAFAWAGGQALARYILDHPDIVRGRTVLDLASGSGLVGIAAAKAGATRVECADIDPFSATAIALNAAANGVDIGWTLHDRIGLPVAEDILLAGDVFYERPMAEKLTTWFETLHEAGTTVLVGDPGRSYLPRQHLESLAVYEVAVSRDLEDSEIKHTTVWAFR